MTPAATPRRIQVRDASDGTLYVLETERPVGGGGEAFVYAVHGEPGLLAKVYKQRTSDIGEKLQLMVANPPRNPTEKIGHQSYAWPKALICGARENTTIGFLMPWVKGMRDVFGFYNPLERLRTCPRFTYRYLMQTARNIAGLMHELHSKGYVIGDVNQKNILVSDSALVTLIDNDSFQIRDPRTGRFHFCRVRTDGFIAPEIYRTNLRSDVERTVEQDLFGLAVVTFHLLMEGVHPFNYIYTGHGEPPTLQERVREGMFPYAPGRKLQPMPTATPFEMLDPELQALFVRCFVDGHGDPSARPTGKEWQQALSKAAQQLRTCAVGPQHYYPAHLGDNCPWCARVRSGLPDEFPDAAPGNPIPRKSSPPRRPDSVAAPKFSSAQETGSGMRSALTCLAILIAVLLLAFRAC